MKYLVPYAAGPRTPMPTCDSLFRMGYDTLEIAQRKGISEAEALRRITILRSHRLGLPDPRERHQSQTNEAAE